MCRVFGASWSGYYVYCDLGRLAVHGAVILDLYSRQVVGWAMSDRLTADFVVKALYQAVGRRRPASGCILHSDRGVQYASADFRDVLKAYGFIQSMNVSLISSPVVCINKD